MRSRRPHPSRSILAVGLALLGLASALRADTKLPIKPVAQKTPVWCWAAVGEMVFRHFRVPNINPAGVFQCGILALLHPACNQNCMNCVVPAGSLHTMDNMLRQYSDFASRQHGQRRRIVTKKRQRSFRHGGWLKRAELEAELDAGRPVVAGISPSGYPKGNVSEHVALIVGYEGDRVIVNDPFPFGRTFQRDPYLAAGAEMLEPGQYSIPYADFRRSLVWRESIFGISCRGKNCGEPTPRPKPTGRSCRTHWGQCGPFMNQAPLPLNAPCHCRDNFGRPHPGRVVKP